MESGSYQRVLLLLIESGALIAAAKVAEFVLYQIEPDDVASKILNEATLAKHQVLSLITHQNRIQVHQAVESELSRTVGVARGGTRGD